MSHLHELKGEADKLVVNSHGQYVVLTPSGAVFRDFFTEDLRKICIAFGRLFDGDWREATESERTAWLAKPPGHQMVYIDWTDPPPQERKLRVVPLGDGHAEGRG